jgi:hypothetical protein
MLVPVGPGDRELVRLQALVQGLRRAEDPQAIHLIVVDDGPAARELSITWPDMSVVRTGLWKDGTRPDAFSAHVAGTLEGLRVARDRDLEAVVKLDTDAAIIAPFARTISTALRSPELGVVGSYDVGYDGGLRDWTMWERTLRRASWPVAVSRRGRGAALQWRSRAQRAHVRQVRSAAWRAAPVGAHCLGGAYAVSGAFIRGACLDWEPWVGTGLGEDVVVGLLCAALGLTMKSLTGPGEPFAIAWRGLPAAPAEIAARRHSIVHSIKRDDPTEERALIEALWQASAQYGARVSDAAAPGSGSTSDTR